MFENRLLTRPFSRSAHSSGQKENRRRLGQKEHSIYIKEEVKITGESDSSNAKTLGGAYDRLTTLMIYNAYFAHKTES